MSQPEKLTTNQKKYLRGIAHGLNPMIIIGMVPESAILWHGSLPAVYKLDDAGELKLRIIRIGERTGQGQVAVISGIKAGDKILAQPGAGTRSGN